MPPVLLELLSAHPEVRRWFTDELGVTDLHDGAPTVGQLHENPFAASPGLAKYLEGDFNNPAAYTDAVATVDGQVIRVHKHIVAKGCEALAKCWSADWNPADKAVALDTVAKHSGLDIPLALES